MIQTGLFTSRLDIEETAGLAEGLDDEKGELTVTVIRPGFNAGKKHFYPADTLRRDFKVFEGAKMFADHATAAEEKDRLEGSVRRWAGSIKQVWAEADGTVKAKAAVIDEDLKGFSCT